MKLEKIGPNAHELVLMDGTKILFSYETSAAAFLVGPDGSQRLYRTTHKWSNTTSRHISQWLSKYPGVSVQIVEQTWLDDLAQADPDKLPHAISPEVFS